MTEETKSDGVDPDLVKQWEAEVLDARHRLLVNRDYIIGVEAEVGRLRRDLAQVTTQLATAQRRLKTVTARRDDLKKRLAATRERLQASQQRGKRLTERVGVLEGELARVRTRPSLTRRMVRRMRGAAR